MDQPQRRHRIGEQAAIDDPRTRLSRVGPGALSTEELLDLVWAAEGRGRAALERLEGLAGLAGASVGDLAAIPAVGPVRAARLAAALELGRRSAAEVPAS